MGNKRAERRRVEREGLAADATPEQRRRHLVGLRADWLRMLPELIRGIREAEMGLSAIDALEAGREELGPLPPPSPELLDAIQRGLDADLFT